MEYTGLSKALLRAGNMPAGLVIEAIAEYVGASPENIKDAMMPLLRIWNEADAAKKPIICIWRHLATSQFESYAVMRIAKRHSGIPLWLTYKSDIFSKNNTEKMIFEKIKLYGTKGKNVETLHIYANEKGRSVDEQLAEIEKKPFTCIELKMNGSKTMIDYHLALRQKAGFNGGGIVDLGEIFEKLFALRTNWNGCKHCVLKSCKEWYYPILMMIASRMVFLENYETCKDNMRDLVEYSLERAVEKNLIPNFVLLPSDKSLDWYMTKPENEGGVPSGIENKIEEIMNQ